MDGAAPASTKRWVNLSAVLALVTSSATWWAAATGAGSSRYTQALAQGISSRGTVVAAGLDGPVTDSARVLVAVSTQFTSPDAPQGAEQTQQLVITMAHMPDGRWLASALDSLPDTAP